jgi:predicted transcriptional regulator
MLEDSNDIEGRMDKKQKEAFVLALLEKGETYREIARQAGVSPNTIKAIANKAGLDETTSISSRAFELYSQQRIPSPLIAAIKLGLKTEEAIRYHQEYFMLLGLTEFTRAYLAIKENIWQFLDLVKLVQNARIGNNEVIELLKIANGHLPRVRLEYGRIIDEINWHKAELNSWKAAVSNEVRVYQDFCDRNLALIIGKMSINQFSILNLFES